MELLLPIVADDTASLEVISLASLALGFIFVGSANGEIAGTVLQTIMERLDSDESTPSSSTSLSDKWSRFLILGLALLYVGQQDASEATIETLKAIPHESISKQAQILVDICSFAGTSNVLKVQSLLHHCADHIVAPAASAEGAAPAPAPAAAAPGAAAPTAAGATEAAEASQTPKEKEDDTFQAFAVIGIALVAMGEDVGAEMSLRQFNHLVSIRRRLYFNVTAEINVFFIL